MSLFASALQPLIVSSLYSLHGKVDFGSIPDLVIDRKAAYSLSFDEPQQEISLDFRETGAIARAIASDICRMSTAAMQSISSVNQELSNKDSLPWGLIKLYYAAFYAAHAVTRLIGHSYCHFEARHIRKIADLGEAIGTPAPFRLASGMYWCVVNATGTALSCVRANESSQGGSHDAFWTFFEGRIRSIGDQILTGPLYLTEAQHVVTKLEEFRRLLAHNSAFGWLSKIRNEVQYRHAHEAWYPSPIRKRDIEALADVAGNWRSDPMDISLTIQAADSSLHRFATACSFLISCCRTVLLYLQDRSNNRRRSFITFGPVAYLNTVRH